MVAVLVLTVWHMQTTSLPGSHFFICKTHRSFESPTRGSKWPSKGPFLQPPLPNFDLKDPNLNQVFAITERQTSDVAAGMFRHPNHPSR
ncbi:hypothetical protein F4781DRAFT_161458 [Annulohypoxylon bovei var. microspora]|nr:hypothetical protein F4781DRAFT_161458 [Annulohypoxylon bovei var. microspora]